MILILDDDDDRVRQFRDAAASAAPGVDAIRSASSTSANGMVWLTITAYFSQFAMMSLVTSKISSG